jgi:uncharacterized RDD family membrane protein YckC
MKASFIKRFLAYLIDIVILYFVLAIVTMGISDTKLTKLQEQLNEVQDKYLNEEIEMGEYISEMASIEYDIQKASVVSNTIYVALLIGYFLVFQYMNKGQTLGKMVLKIRVVENGNSPSILAMFVRTFIINQIFVNILAILLVYALNDYGYLMVYGVLSIINIGVIFASVFMILFRKDKRGLQDVLSRTSVEEV